MNKMAFLILLTSIFISCTKNEELFQKDLQKMELEILDDNFLWPRRLAAVEDKLIFLDDKENHFLHLYDPIQKKILFSDFNIGAGPKELIGPFTTMIDSKNQIWIHGIVKNWLQKYTLSGSSITIDDKIGFKDIQLSDPTFLNDSTLIAINLSDPQKGWVVKLNINGEYLSSVVDFPKNTANTPPRVFAESYQGVLRIKPDCSRFVLGTRLADILNFYSNSGELLMSYRTQDSFDPIFKVSMLQEHSLMGQYNETRIGFTGIATSNEFVFASFSGKTRAVPNPTYANYILKFSWDGVLIDAYYTSLPVLSYTWSEIHQSLYFFVMRQNKKTLAKYNF